MCHLIFLICFIYIILLTPLITKPLRITENSVSLIDQIWTNFVCKSYSCIVVSGITDHYITFYNLGREMKSDKSELKKFKFRDFLSINIEHFKSVVSETDWFGILGSSGCPNEYTNNFIAKIFSIYNSW